jgi:hypothetical protein
MNNWSRQFQKMGVSCNCVKFILVFIVGNHHENKDPSRAYIILIEEMTFVILDANNFQVRLTMCNT